MPTLFHTGLILIAIGMLVVAWGLGGWNDHDDPDASESEQDHA